MLPVCLLACLSACLFACLPVCLRAYLLSCVHTCLPACLSACLPACMLAGLLVCLPACPSTCLSSCMLACLLALQALLYIHFSCYWQKNPSSCIDLHDFDWTHHFLHVRVYILIMKFLFIFLCKHACLFIQ